MEEDAFKRAARDLRAGAKLTTENCPVCDFILLEMEGRLYCSKCEREVIFTESSEEYVKLSTKFVLNQLKGLIVKRIDGLRTELDTTSLTDSSILTTLDHYLSILGRIEDLLARQVS